jgi:osmoprotectant transport system ATP-binding protein
MTVSDNIAVVPRLLGWAAERIGRRVDELLTMVGLEPADFRGRFPAQLSGGQRQRVGVARALAADPPIVLMDEPFGALDPITREQLQSEFTDLEDRLRKTVLFVTHDIFEAVKLGDRIALLDAGRLQQLGTPAEIVESPANDFVDQFLGEHRFQLALLTRTVRQLVEPGQEPPAGEQGPRIRVSHSIIEALDAFKRTSRERIPAYDEHGAYKGDIRRAGVLEAIADAVGGARSGEGAEA